MNSKKPLEALIVAEDEEEESAPETSLAALVADLSERVVAVEGAMTQHNHTIAPEFIESIIQQAAKRAMQQVVAQLRKTADILEALEK